MTNLQTMIADHDADVNLTILMSILMDVRDLVIESHEAHYADKSVSASVASELDRVDDHISSLKITGLLMLCSAWLIERISSVSDRALGTATISILPKRSLRDEFDACGHLKQKPTSLLEAKVQNMCSRLERLDKWLC